MGKITGFMEYERLEEGYEPIQQRVKNYKEFVIGLKADEAKTGNHRYNSISTTATLMYFCDGMKNVIRIDMNFAKLLQFMSENIQ